MPSVDRYTRKDGQQYKSKAAKGISLQQQRRFFLGRGVEMLFSCE
jgi:hypothetical protein